MRVVLADVDDAALTKAGKEIAEIAGENNVLAITTDVSKIDEVERLREKAFETWGEARVFNDPHGHLVLGGRERTWAKYALASGDVEYAKELACDRSGREAVVGRVLPAEVGIVGEPHGVL